LISKDLLNLYNQQHESDLKSPPPTRESSDTDPLHLVEESYIIPFEELEFTSRTLGIGYFGKVSEGSLFYFYFILILISTLERNRSCL
jgi:hypothetical protein